MEVVFADLLILILNEAGMQQYFAREELVNLSKYPIIPTLPGYSELVAHCQKQMREQSCCELPNFVTQNILAQMAMEADNLKTQSHRSIATGNPYIELSDLSLPENHPRRFTETTKLSALAYDLIPQNALVRVLYEWDALLNFISAIIDQGKLYRYADELGALNISVMNKGDNLQWHFDQTDFVVSLTLQACESGGDFEYVPNIREQNSENYDAVYTALTGKHPQVKKLPITPGTLLLFKGRYSIHRVTQLTGERTRLMALFGYDTNPDVRNSDQMRFVRYGRFPASITAEMQAQMLRHLENVKSYRE